LFPMPRQKKKEKKHGKGGQFRQKKNKKDAVGGEANRSKKPPRGWMRETDFKTEEK